MEGGGRLACEVVDEDARGIWGATGIRSPQEKNCGRLCRAGVDGIHFGSRAGVLSSPRFCVPNEWQGR